MSRHLMARFRHLHAAHYEEPPEMPHDDWQVYPNYNNAETRDDLTPEQKAQVYHQWHPYHGESFVQYHIFPPNRPGDQWHASHSGINKGMMSGTDPHGHSYNLNDYDPLAYESIGTFSDPEQGRRAVEDFHRRRYGQPPTRDYDINQIMRDEGF